ncbi:MAG: SpoIID/LytB domain-containing protein [Phormidesmis sp. RL_2_1]|nr:SpoIID/LytB domain-containing protein [Phormidesmis sp. RL_2_1]
MSAQTASFAKNWLFGLTTDSTIGKEQTSPFHSSALRWSLRWWGGLLLWLLLVLPAQAAVELRVAIAQGNEAIRVGSSTTGIIRDSGGQALYQLPELQAIILEADNNMVDLTNGNQTLAESSAFWLEPSADGFVWIGDKWYRGRVLVTLADGELTAINYVDLEDYLYSVVGSEMPTSWPQAALQSQAVAARSYALYKRSRNRNPLYDVDATTTYQAYKGIAQEAASTIAAVDSTKNNVVTYNGEVIEAIFHSSSGGHTENAGEIWSSDVPYLRGVEDYDQNAPVYRWEETFSLDDFSSRLGNMGTVRSIGTPRLTTQGRVSSISITGDNGTQTFKGSDIRSALRLRSTRFTIRLNEDTNQVSVTGFGFGHGVGMSQWGARSLAEQGWSYEQILEHYYQSTAIALLES